MFTFQEQHIYQQSAFAARAKTELPMRPQTPVGHWCFLRVFTTVRMSGRLCGLPSVHSHMRSFMSLGHSSGTLHHSIAAVGQHAAHETCIGHQEHVSQLTKSLLQRAIDSQGTPDRSHLAAHWNFASAYLLRRAWQVVQLASACHVNMLGWQQYASFASGKHICPCQADTGLKYKHAVQACVELCI